MKQMRGREVLACLLLLLELVHSRDLLDDGNSADASLAAVVSVAGLLDASVDVDVGVGKGKALYVIDLGARALFRFTRGGKVETVLQGPPFVNPIGLLPNTFKKAYKGVNGFFVADFASCFNTFNPFCPGLRTGHGCPDSNFPPSPTDGLIHFVPTDGSPATTIYKGAPLTNPTKLFAISDTLLGIVDTGYENGPNRNDVFDGALYQLDLSQADSPGQLLPPTALQPYFPSNPAVCPSRLGDPNGIVPFQGGYLLTDGQNGLQQLKNGRLSTFAPGAWLTQKSDWNGNGWQPVDLVVVGDRVVFTDYFKGVFSINKQGDPSSLVQLVQAQPGDKRRFLGIKAINPNQVIVLHSKILTSSSNPAEILVVDVRSGAVGSPFSGDPLIEPFDLVIWGADN